MLTQTEDRDHQAAHTVRMGRPHVILTYSFWKLSPALLRGEWKSLSPPLISSDHTKLQLSGRLEPTQADPGPYVYMSVGQASPTPHPSFSAKAPRLRELEAVDSYGPLENLIRGQGIVFGLV